MQTIRSVLFWSFENIPSGKVLQKDDKKKLGFFLVQNYVFTSEWKFLWGWFNFRERVKKKTVKTFLFYTRFSVWFLASYFDYLSRLLQFFLVYIPRINHDSLAFPPLIFTETCKLVWMNIFVALKTFYIGSVSFSEIVHILI